MKPFVCVAAILIPMRILLDSRKNARKFGTRRTKTVVQRVMIDLGTRDPDKEARTLGDSMLGGLRRGGFGFGNFYLLSFILIDGFVCRGSGRRW